MRTRIAALAIAAAAGITALVGVSASPAAADNPKSVSTTSDSSLITLLDRWFQTLGRIM